MTARIVRLGSPRFATEGLRIGTVRRVPRGVPAARFACDDWFDVWYPELSPSAELMKQGKASILDKEWQQFTRAFRGEMAGKSAQRTLQLLAALSHHSNFSVGCYCEDESRCHRSILRELLVENGALIIC